MTSFLENLTHTDTIDTATTTASPSGTTVQRVSESYPIRMRSLFQTPHQGQKDFFNLPAGVEQSLQRSTTVSVNGTQTFSSWLDDTVNAVRAPQPHERRYHAVGRPRQRGLSRVRLDGLLLPPQARR